MKSVPGFHGRVRQCGDVCLFLHFGEYATAIFGSLWLMPYMEATMAAFYLDLKGEFDKKEEPVIELETKEYENLK